MREAAHKATLLLVIGNTLLFVLKLIVGLMSNSIAIISDAINSLTDIVASFVVLICVRLSRKRADLTHPFGHHRIEPIAGLIVAILIAIVGGEVIRAAIKRLISGETIFFSLMPVAVLVFTMALKAFMAVYLKNTSRKINSPAIFASSVDCRNDVFISGTALLGLVGYHFGYTYLDPIAGIVIGLWIILSGYQVGRSNIDYLIGGSPSRKTIEHIKRAALSVRGVRGLNDVRAHYVGNYIHVEVHIELNKKLSMVKAHNIGKKVESKIEELPWVNKAFIHIDPV